METNLPSIVQVVGVVDTREWIEDGDRWVAVSGSGTARNCDRCRREHEVHATVLLSDGATAVVGTGCMRGESMEVTKALARGANAAKRFARLSAELASLLRACAQWDVVRAEIEALPVPELVDSKQKRSLPGEADIPVLRCGDTSFWHETAATATAETKADLIRHWRDNRMRERGVSSYRPRTDDLERRVAAARAAAGLK